MKKVTLIANGDLRLSANRNCWNEQQKVEEAVISAFGKFGIGVERGHKYDEEKGHGFIDSQKYGMEVFKKIDPVQPLVIAFAAWQYSHHILHGLMSHQGPILTIANWSGTWPGLVGMLNMNGCLAKASVPYSTLWSEDFTDETFIRGLTNWLDKGTVEHAIPHIRPFKLLTVSQNERELGELLAQELLTQKAIMGVFDEGCMGMYNAIVPDELMNKIGIFKERLSQSALYYEVTQISDSDAKISLEWLLDKGMKFKIGTDEEKDLTQNQILQQLKMYIAALRIADDFGCSTIGIQYQQGLKDLLPASDLAEGLLNNSERPPALSRDGKRILYEGEPLPHFNEVDECAGIDALITNRIWKKLGYEPETTLHDLRWGDNFNGEFVWVFMISGAVPPAHLKNGFRGATSERQPPMYFRLGGGTIKGVSKPGEVVWSRVFIQDQKLKADIGIARAIELPNEETERRLKLTTPQWPIMHAVTYGVSRDEMMARHKSNHIQVAYVPDEKAARKAAAAKAAAFNALGIETYVCGKGIDFS
jgi:L-fucose isomerase-like protein